MEIILSERAKKLDHLNFIPKLSTANSIGYDVFACIEADILLVPNVKVTIPLGFHLKLENKGALLLPRSGLGSSGFRLANTVGLIDPDYQDEWLLKVIFSPENDEVPPLRIKQGMKIAQFILLPLLTAEPVTIVDSFSTPQTRFGGFNSTSTDNIL